MINVILIAMGAAVFILSFWKYIGIIRYMKKGRTRTEWIILFAFTFFFLIGYVFQILVEYWNIPLDDRLMISVVYFMGAVYVFLVVSLSLSSVKQIKKQEEKTHELKKSSEELDALVKERTKELEKSKTELEKKIHERTKELEKAKNELEQQVRERTKELEQKVTDFERLNKASIGRELRMIELKKRIQELESKLKNKS
jgi:C4-dicarboxylate-specific signal transduction histidine kinase